MPGRVEMTDKTLPISAAEDLMAKVLRKSGKPLTIKEIAERIRGMDRRVLTGATPDRSLYSIVYRRESRREQAGWATLFQKSTEGGATTYSLKTTDK